MNFEGTPLLTYFHWFPEVSVTDYVEGKYKNLYAEFNRVIE